MKNIVQLFLLMLLSGQLFAQAIQINCPVSPVTFCDVTPNSISLWNETYWYDPQNDISNLPEGPVDLNITITDTCASVSISYLLFLDLDQNGTQETVVNSDNLPGFNNVQFDNALNPNYTGGTARAFDERSVNTDEKYGFALQTTVNGNNRTAALRWNTQQVPNTYTIPELPYGNHKIKWIVTDVCGNESSCEYNFIVKDCKPPTIVCINGLFPTMPPNQQLQLWAVDFLQYAEDNATPTVLLEYAIRKSGTGAGFPIDSLTGEPQIKVIFDCTELGIQSVEIWSRDAAGNADFCETYVIVGNAAQSCPGEVQQITTCINFWKDGSPVKMDVNLLSVGLPIDTSQYNSVYDSLGCLVVTLNNASGSNLTITPVLTADPLDGVNTLDLIAIARHILGIVPLGSPYALLAADANKSGSITSFDIVEYKKLMLGIYAVLPNNTSWRFVDAGFQFPNPNNPFATAFPEGITVTNLDSVTHLAFKAIKIGDVDGDAYPGFGAPAEDRATTVVTLPDATLSPGETVELPMRIQTPGEWLGLQMGLHFDPQLLEITLENSRNLPEWDATSWATPQPGLVQMAWFSLQPQRWLPDENVLTLRVRALAPVRLRDALSFSSKTTPAGITAAAISAANTLRPLQLVFESPVASTSGTTIFAPQPNPFADSEVRIPVRLGQGETVRLQLLDLTGRVLFQNEQILEAGSHLLVMPSTAFAQNGVYVWRVQAGSTVASGKVVKNK